MDEVLSLDIKQFKYENQTALENIKLSAKRGECMILTGLSGCGKTTLLRLINGLIPEIYEGELTGGIMILGRNIDSYKSGELAQYMGNVFQNINDQIFSNGVEDEIALVGENMGMDRAVLIEKVRDITGKLGLSKMAGIPIRKLSGGQKQKVAIASTLVYDADLIILDEPSSSLDYHSTEELKETLNYLKSLNKTIIIAEHRLYYLKELIDRLVVVKDGRIEHIYLRQELTKKVQTDNCLRDFDETALKHEAIKHKDEVKIEVKDIRIHNREYRLKYTIDFTLKERECMALLAPNGMGKTTLAKQLVGLLNIKNGSTSFGRTRKERIKNTAISLQNCADMFFFESVEKELIPGDLVKDQLYLEKVKKYLIALDLWDKRHMLPQALSGGEKQRLSIISAMLKTAELLILDEPTSGLDYKRMDMVSGLIKEKSQEIPIILISHDLELIYKVCNTALLLFEDHYEKIEIQEDEEKIRSFLKNHE